jgi:hypothetical protein
MNELDWRRLERRMIEAHVAADPPLSREIWRGVEALLADRRPARRKLRLALGVVVLAAAAVVLWLLPRMQGGEPVTRSAEPSAATASNAPTGETRATPGEGSSGSVGSSGPAAGSTGASSGTARAPELVPPVTLNQILEPKGAVTFVMSAHAGRIEIEPCRGRFVNVTVLDSPHRTLALIARDRRVEVQLDGGALTSGVAHILVPADTHLVLETRSGPIVVRGLGGPIEITTDSGEASVDSASRSDPAMTITTDTGAIAWRGRCGRRCRVEARSRTGDITLRSLDPGAFTRGAARAESQAGTVHLEELPCTDLRTDPRCSSSPLPWRQAAPNNGH